MTEGMSQGLLIVVAIVIFGIFVVMAYFIFEDTLSPAMANLFSWGTEQAVDDTNDSMNIITEATDVEHFRMYYNDGSGKEMINAARERTTNEIGQSLSVTRLQYDTVEELKEADFTFGNIRISDKDGIKEVRTNLISLITYVDGNSDLAFESLEEKVIFTHATGNQDVQINLDAVEFNGLFSFNLPARSQNIIQLELEVVDTLGNISYVQYVFKRMLPE